MYTKLDQDMDGIEIGNKCCEFINRSLCVSVCNSTCVQREEIKMMLKKEVEDETRVDR